MIEKSDGTVRWLEFELFQSHPHVVHGVFLRTGGVSSPPFDSLNVANYVGDDPKAVEENRRRVERAVGVPLVICNQVHGNRVVVYGGQNPGECDGLMTDQVGVGLTMQHADCQIALFFDPVKQVIANVHSGWKGNVLNIYAKAIANLKKEWGCQPSDLLVGISPSLGPCHAEFINYREDLPESFLPFQKKGCLFDLWEIAHFQLLNAGIDEKHIEVAEECTFAKKEHFFSYRRDKKTGRHATVLALKPCDLSDELVSQG